jgi:Fe-S-cluster-containing hydrogenase component 2
MLVTKKSRCTGCEICMQICSWMHFQDMTTKRSRIQIVENWPQVPSIRVCLACKGHECVDACPHNALTWKEWVHVDKALCDGCGACVEACPVEGITLDAQTHLPLVCDTCRGAYQCVQWCPTGALIIRNP